MKKKLFKKQTIAGSIYFPQVRPPLLCKKMSNCYRDKLL